MTIDTLIAGRALDALIAERVMNEDPYHVDVISGDRIIIGACPNYSTEMADAWLVVEKLRPLKLFLIAEWEGGRWPMLEDDNASRGYEVSFFHNAGYEWNVRMKNGADVDPVWANTAPLAICLAALKAVEV